MQVTCMPLTKTILLKFTGSVINLSLIIKRKSLNKNDTSQNNAALRQV